MTNRNRESPIHSDSVFEILRVESLDQKQCPGYCPGIRDAATCRHPYQRNRKESKVREVVDMVAALGFPLGFIRELTSHRFSSPVAA